MIFIKNYKQLNESTQEGIEIMKVIEDSPEGKDLFAAGKGEGPTTRGLTDIFDLKKGGRIYFKPSSELSKTYIWKENGRYYFESYSSNGGAFGTEGYNTIEECLRNLWSKLIALRKTPRGHTKEEFRKWVLSNIPPGEELNMEEIQEKFFKLTGKEYPNFDNLESSTWFKFLEVVFNCRLDITIAHSTGNESLRLKLFDPFEINACNNPIFNKEVALFIDKTSKRDVKKIKVEPYKTRIEIGPSDDVGKSIFDSIIKIWEKNVKDGGINIGYNKFPKICEGLIEILDILKQSSKSNSLESMAKIFINSPQKFKMISMAKDKLPEIYKEIEKIIDPDTAEDSVLLGGLGF